VVIYTLLLIRFDRIFWVPNGSAKAGDYRMLSDVVQDDEQLEEGAELEERAPSSGGESMLRLKEKKNGDDEQ